MFAFWGAVRAVFAAAEPKLWQQPTDSSPNNLLKIVTLQELQGVTFDAWADVGSFAFTSPEATREATERFWVNFPHQFFVDEWKLKGLQTSVGRTVLRKAIRETRRKHGQRSWGHRRLALFKGEGGE
jgi:hypothetical protein